MNIAAVLLVIPEGRKLIIADYSQIELRILAEFSGDQGFHQRVQFGRRSASRDGGAGFQRPLDQVTKEQRDFAKRLNFGVVYGIGAQRFSMMTGIERAGSGKCFAPILCDLSTARYLFARSGESRGAARSRRALHPAGWCVSVTIADDRQQISMTQRNGKNTPIQGTSADILKRALRLLKDELRDTSRERS